MNDSRTAKGRLDDTTQLLIIGFLVWRKPGFVDAGIEVALNPRGHLIYL